MRTIAALSLSLLFVACASSSGTPARTASEVNLGKPGIEVTQLSSVGAAARHITGPVPIQFGIKVTNNAEDAITLTQVSLQTLGGGAYDVKPTTNPFKVAIAPNESKNVNLWAPGNVAIDSVAGVNGPVTLRVTLYFDSPKGKFQEIVVENVMSPTGV
jgi:hypothetical protein